MDTTVPTIHQLSCRHAAQLFPLIAIQLLLVLAQWGSYLQPFPMLEIGRYSMACGYLGMLKDIKGTFLALRSSKTFSSFCALHSRC